MRPLFLLVTLCLATLPAVAQTATPGHLFPSLSEAIYLGRIFPENKAFVGVMPLQPPTQILTVYSFD